MVTSDKSELAGSPEGGNLQFILKEVKVCARKRKGLGTGAVSSTAGKGDGYVPRVRLLRFGACVVSEHLARC